MAMICVFLLERKTVRTEIKVVRRNFEVTSISVTFGTSAIFRFTTARHRSPSVRLHPAPISAAGLRGTMQAPQGDAPQVGDGGAPVTVPPEPIDPAVIRGEKRGHVEVAAAAMNAEGELKRYVTLLRQTVSVL